LVKRSTSRRGARRAGATDGVRQILVLSGPNLDRLGLREPEVYGSTTLEQIHAELGRIASARSTRVDCRQTHHEGDLVGWIWEAVDAGFDGILINPGALTHSSYALYDALKGASVPAVEVHLSNPDAREPFRRRSLVAPVCLGRVAGFGARSYTLALQALLDLLDSKAATASASKG
jgi:3-dehydroquinate dehydratase-2